MEKPTKFLLPSPVFGKNEKAKPLRHYLTPSGMTLLPREKQPPPMYGKRGATVPAKYLQETQQALSPGTIAVCKSTPPEPQHCEPCEMDFQTNKDLRLHQKHHEPCPVDGCNFHGHPTVLDKHVSELHLTGLYDAVKKMSTPEEIAAWRNDRRKKYPTVASVELRKRAQEQRQRRGERLEPSKSRFGKMEDRRRIQKGDARNQERHERKPNEKRANKRRKVQQRFEQKHEEEQSKAEIVEQEQTCGGVAMFKGTSGLIDYKHFQSKNDLEENVLSKLLGMYGSDDDSSEASENETLEKQQVNVSEHIEPQMPQLIETIDGNQNKKEENVVEVRFETPSNLTESSDEAPEEVPIERFSQPETIETDSPSQLVERTCDAELNINNNAEVDANINVVNLEVPNIETNPVADAVGTGKINPFNRSKMELRKRKSGLDYRKARLRKQNTMLEKLLEPDIRHERNVLLQCVRFVCENNFFGIGKNSK